MNDGRNVWLVAAGRPSPDLHCVHAVFSDYLGCITHAQAEAAKIVPGFMVVRMLCHAFEPEVCRLFWVSQELKGAKCGKNGLKMVTLKIFL